MAVRLVRVGSEWNIQGWGNESLHLTDDELRDLVRQAAVYGIENPYPNPNPPRRMVTDSRDQNLLQRLREQTRDD